MSLTNNDLKAIGTLIDQRLEKKLEEKLEQKLAPIKAELQSHGKTLKYLKNKVNTIDKTVDVIGRTFDKRIVQNTREINRIKDHVGLPAKLN